MTTRPAAGTLRHSVSLEASSATQNAYGEQTLTWASFASTRAAIEPVAAREQAIARGFAATVSHKVTIRYRTDLDTKQRIVFGDRVFLVNGIINGDEENRRLEVYCTEVL